LFFFFCFFFFFFGRVAYLQRVQGPAHDQEYKYYRVPPAKTETETGRETHKCKCPDNRETTELE
jgi:hypothetical protein